MLDNPFHLQQAAVLAVLGLPAVVAALCAVLGRRDARTARRVAVNGALLHLGLAAVFVAAFYPALAFDRTGGAELTPWGVPGDPGVPWSADSETHRTTWGVLSLAPPQAGAAGLGVPAAEVQFFVGVDGLNIWLVVLASVMTLVAVLVSWDTVTDRAGAYYAWVFLLHAAVTGCFLAFDIVLFYVFFELTLIPAFFLIGRWGVGGARRDAARKFFLYTLFGSLLTLTGLIGTVLTNPTPLDPAGRPVRIVNENAAGGYDLPAAGPVTFSIPRLMENAQTWQEVRRRRVFVAANAARAAVAESQAAAVDPARQSDAGRLAAVVAERTAAVDAATAAGRASRRVQTLLFFLLMCGFAVKIPVVPFHTWLPAAYTEAPMPVTMLLSALLAKLGTFGVLRVVLPVMPGPALEYGLPVFGTLGAIGIVYGAFCAFAQRDLKRVVAYSSISHLGFLVIALFTGTEEGLAGATLHMVNHGLSTGAMFALLGFLVARYRTTDGAQFSGLFARYPAYGVLFMVASLASVGVPGLNNFVSEMLMLAALFEPAVAGPAGYSLAIAAAAGVFLSAWYTMTLVRRAFFGPLREPSAGATVTAGLTPAERLGFGLPVLLCVVLGIVPGPLLATIRPDAETLARHADWARARAGLAVPASLHPTLTDAEVNRRGMVGPPPGMGKAGGPPGPPRVGAAPRPPG